MARIGIGVMARFSTCTHQSLVKLPMPPPGFGCQFDPGDRLSVPRPLPPSFPTRSKAARLMKLIHVDEATGVHLVTPRANWPSRSVAMRSFASAAASVALAFSGWAASIALVALSAHWISCHSNMNLSP
jgi:hypothetical protein